MSQQNSDFDPLFESAEFSSPMAGPMDANFSGSVQPVVGVQTPTVHGFTVYTVMLILSFIALTTASILLFLDANKY
jgi:hypothetical protein